LGCCIAGVQAAADGGAAEIGGGTGLDFYTVFVLFLLVSLLSFFRFVLTFPFGNIPFFFELRFGAEDGEMATLLPTRARSSEKSAPRTAPYRTRTAHGLRVQVLPCSP
jgi:hypothetical protein